MFPGVGETKRACVARGVVDSGAAGRTGEMERVCALSERAEIEGGVWVKRDGWMDGRRWWIRKGETQVMRGGFRRSRVHTHIPHNAAVFAGCTRAGRPKTDGAAAFWMWLAWRSVHGLWRLQP